VFEVIVLLEDPSFSFLAKAARLLAKTSWYWVKFIMPFSLSISQFLTKYFCSCASIFKFRIVSGDLTLASSTSARLSKLRREFKNNILYSVNKTSIV
jgi:hypothetical protein